MKRLAVLAAVLPIVASANAAMAGLYSGAWPATATLSQTFNGDHCVVLTDDGSLGFAHSGMATLDGAMSGTFQVIGQTLLVTIEDQSHIGQNAGLVFTARASSGILGVGVWDNVYGGESIDEAKVVFGKKGGC